MATTAWNFCQVDTCKNSNFCTMYLPDKNFKILKFFTSYLPDKKSKKFKINFGNFYSKIWIKINLKDGDCGLWANMGID